MAKYYSYSSRAVELSVLSGEDLRLARKFIKIKKAFIVVRSDANNFRMTEMDGGDGGSHPKWNEKLVLHLPAHAQALTLEVHCKTAFGDRIVGTASVPVSRGERNGIINFSVRMKVPASEYTCSASASAPEQMTVGVPVRKSNFGFGIVTGVPVLCAYSNRSF